MPNPRHSPEKLVWDCQIPGIPPEKLAWDCQIPGVPLKSSPGIGKSQAFPLKSSPGIGKSQAFPLKSSPSIGKSQAFPGDLPIIMSGKHPGCSASSKLLLPAILHTVVYAFQKVFFFFFFKVWKNSKSVNCKIALQAGKSGPFLFSHARPGLPNPGLFCFPYGLYPYCYTAISMKAKVSDGVATPSGSFSLMHMGLTGFGSAGATKS